MNSMSSAQTNTYASCVYGHVENGLKKWRCPGSMAQTIMAAVQNIIKR